MNAYSFGVSDCSWMLELDELLPGDVVQDPDLTENNHTALALQTLICIDK